VWHADREADADADAGWHAGSGTTMLGMTEIKSIELYLEKLKLNGETRQNNIGLLIRAWFINLSSLSK
jgi:hypothetical protein